ncbi:MAG: hypothetical protein LAN71_01625 [Acidobacteriia bacterium]|nr:hypothetical protein [Terriglobia bacterium]
MEKPIRVLVANRPRLIRELIMNTFTEQPDIEIVGEVTDEAEIPERVESTHPDFVIIAQDRWGKRPDVCDTVLQLHPEVRIIAVSPGQNCSVCYWASLDIHASNIEASEEGILSTLRGKGAVAGESS